MDGCIANDQAPPAFYGCFTCSQYTYNSINCRKKQYACVATVEYSQNKNPSKEGSFAYNKLGRIEITEVLRLRQLLQEFSWQLRLLRLELFP